MSEIKIFSRWVWEESVIEVMDRSQMGYVRLRRIKGPGKDELPFWCHESQFKEIYTPQEEEPRTLSGPPGTIAHLCTEGCPAWHRAWMSPDLKVAIQMNDDGTIDEVLTEELHIEQMDDDHYWMNLGDIHFAFTIPDKKKKRVVELRISWADTPTPE